MASVITNNYYFVENKQDDSPTILTLMFIFNITFIQILISDFSSIYTDHNIFIYLDFFISIYWLVYYTNKLDFNSIVLSYGDKKLLFFFKPLFFIETFKDMIFSKTKLTSKFERLFFELLNLRRKEK